MPFGLPSVATAFHRNLRSVMAGQEARHHAVLVEMETTLKEPPGPLEPPKAEGLMRENPFAAYLQLPQHPSINGTR